MNKRGEIILVEDDIDDQSFFEQAYSELGIKNKLTVLPNGQKAYEYFNNTAKDIFLIISDINMPQMTGIELREKMQKEGEVKLRTLPFLFLTTGIAKNTLIQEYAKSVQGLFIKPLVYKELKTTIQHIVSYWTSCKEVA